MVNNLVFFSSKCSLFHNSNIFGSRIIHILHTGCAKIKKNNSSAKRLINCKSQSSCEIFSFSVSYYWWRFKYSGTLRTINWWTVTNVLEKHTASIFRGQQSKDLDLQKLKQFYIIARTLRLDTWKSSITVWWNKVTVS